MTEKAESKARTRDSFRVNGRCVTNGFLCESGHDCRGCMVPVSFGLIKIANAINPVSKKDMRLAKKLESIEGLTEAIRKDENNEDTENKQEEEANGSSKEAGTE